MKLLEFEAKQILALSGVAVPQGEVVRREDTLTLSIPVVLKSQVPVGGRGKAGGIVVAKDQQQLAEVVQHLFELEIKGHQPQALLAEEVLDIDREHYLSLLIDRSTASIQLMAHIQGGVEVEANDQSSFFQQTIDTGTLNAVAQQLGTYFGLTASIAVQQFLEHLYKAFIANDATLLEINPLVVTRSGQLVAGDAKMTLDDAAAFRHDDWRFADQPADANFVVLHPNGSVATIANGAGLAMATVDQVADSGLSPANFLDIGGGANEATIYAALERIAAFASVQAIIVNIFAGITRCDDVARAVVAARERLPGLPALFVRLSGTNLAEARTILEAAGIPLQPSLEACIAQARGAVR